MWLRHIKADSNKPVISRKRVPQSYAVHFLSLEVTVEVENFLNPISADTYTSSLKRLPSKAIVHPVNLLQNTNGFNIVRNLWRTLWIFYPTRQSPTSKISDCQSTSIFALMNFLYAQHFFLYNDPTLSPIYSNARTFQVNQWNSSFLVINET